MSAADSISNALIRFGRPMTLRRNVYTNGVKSPTDVMVYGVSRGYKPVELIGPVKQGDTEITFTNKEIAAASWPGPPQKDDIIKLDGRNVVLVVDPEPKYLGTDILVFVCQVRG